MMTGDEWLDELMTSQGKVDMSGRLDMSVTGGPQRHTVYHSYMVSYIYGKFQFGSLVMKEDFDTNTSSAEDIAEFHNKITNEISEYQGEKITILNIVRFN